MRVAEKSTFIKLDRNIQDWRWYSNANTFRVFLHIILNANVKKHGFEGIDIKRGQLVTSYPSMSKKLNLTIQQIRTAINHLKSTGELTVKIYPKFSVITVLNYDLYQDKVTGKLTANQQPINSQLTVNQQQYKNVKNEKNVRSSTWLPPTFFEISSFISENQLNVDAEKFFKHYEDSGWTTKSGKPITDWKALVFKWDSLEKAKPKTNSVWSGMKKLGEDD